MPYPNEHACRLQDPDKFDQFRRGSRQHEGKAYSIIYGHPKGGGGWEEQAFRYPKGSWTAEEARTHCGAAEGSFEAASEAAHDANVSKDGDEPEVLVFDFDALLDDDSQLVTLDEAAAVMREQIQQTVGEALAARLRTLTGRLD